MSVLKISAFILFYFLSRMAFADCETFTRITDKEILCRDDNQAWISERCIKNNCDAKKFMMQFGYKLKNKKDGPCLKAEDACLKLQLTHTNYMGPNGTTIDFCLFTDGSLLEVSVIDRCTR